MKIIFKKRSNGRELFTGIDMNARIVSSTSNCRQKYHYGKMGKGIIGYVF